MTTYTGPPTGAQFHRAYWRSQDELTRTRARVRAERVAAEEERNRPPEGDAPGQ